MDCTSPTCNQLQSTDVDSPLPNELIAYNEIALGADEILQSIDTQVARWGDFTRWLKGDEPKGSSAGFEQRWQGLKSEAYALLEIHEQLNINKKRLDICYQGNCSAARRVELEVERETLNKLNIQMTAISPWWVSEEFLSLAEKEDATQTTEAELKHALISSMTNFFQQSSDLQGQATTIKGQINNILEGKSPPGSLVPAEGLRSDGALEIILKNRMLNSSQRPHPLCDIAKVKETFERARSYITGTIKGGLLLSSLIIGPESLLLTNAVKTAANRGLISRIINFFASGPRAVAYGADAVMTATVINDRLAKGRECEQVQALTQLGHEDHEAWQECLKEREQATLYATLAGLSSSATFALPIVRGLLQARTGNRTPAYTSRVSDDGNTTTVMDLTRGQEIANSELASVSSQYWSFVGNVYRERLNLTPEEIRGFVASSMAFESRTKLVVMTRGPPKNHAFEGGAAIVESNKASDLLPLEKATGVKIPRDQGKIAEVVRLTSVSETNPNVMMDVLKELSTVIKADPEVKKLYVYTSKAHTRLYRRLGIPFKQVGNPIERDVIIELNASDFVNQLTP